MSSTESDVTRGRAGALAALLDVAQDSGLREEMDTARAVFSPEDFEALIAIAWRHQFETDRSHFIREMKELRREIVQKMVARKEVMP